MQWIALFFAYPVRMLTSDHPKILEEGAQKGRKASPTT